MNKDKDLLHDNCDCETDCGPDCCCDLDDIVVVELEGEDGETINAVEVDRFIAEDNTYVIFQPVTAEMEYDEEAEDAFLLKVVFNAQGEEIEYVEPSEKEFEVAQKTYDILYDESDLVEIED